MKTHRAPRLESDRDVILGQRPYACGHRRTLLDHPDPGHQHPEHRREYAEEPGGTGQAGQAEHEHDPSHPGRLDPAHHDGQAGQDAEQGEPDENRQEEIVLQQTQRLSRRGRQPRSSGHMRASKSTDSLADSAGSIPVTRSGPLSQLGWLIHHARPGRPHGCWDPKAACGLAVRSVTRSLGSTYRLLTMTGIAPHSDPWCANGSNRLAAGIQPSANGELIGVPDGRSKAAAQAAAGDMSGRDTYEMLPRAASPWPDAHGRDRCELVFRVHMVRSALDEDEPAFMRALAEVVDLEAHLVFGAPYSGAKVLAGRAVLRGAEHDGAFMQLVVDREHGDAVRAGVRKPTDTPRRNEPQALGLVQPFGRWIPDGVIPGLGIGRSAGFRSERGTVSLSWSAWGGMLV